MPWSHHTSSCYRIIRVITTTIVVRWSSGESTSFLLLKRNNPVFLSVANDRESRYYVTLCHWHSSSSQNVIQNIQFAINDLASAQQILDRPVSISLSFFLNVYIFFSPFKHKIASISREINPAARRITSCETKKADYLPF